MQNLPFDKLRVSVSLRKCKMHSSTSSGSPLRSENEKAFISLGSNVGEREFFLERARKELERIGRILKVSAIYETEPLGDSKRDFLNQVIKLETNLSSVGLFSKLKNIEKKLGRNDRGHWGAREIDLDLLFFADEVSWSQNLKVPHPEIPYRRFVLIPLVEIEPNFIHPIFRLSIQTLLKFCSDKLTVKKCILKKLKNNPPSLVECFPLDQKLKSKSGRVEKTRPSSKRIKV